MAVPNVFDRNIGLCQKVAKPGEGEAAQGLYRLPLGNIRRGELWSLLDKPKQALARATALNPLG
jgi:hypothetical protein